MAIDYFFTQINEKPVCLLCSESVSVMKEYNVRRHYVTKHSAKYDSFQGERRKEKVQNMIKNLKQQQSIFTKKSDNADRSTTFGHGKKGADNKGATKRAQNKKGAEQKGHRAKMAQNKKGARSRCCVTVTFKVVISSDNRVLSQSFFFFFVET